MVLLYQVGIEECLHIEFEYDKARYHLKVRPLQTITQHCTACRIEVVSESCSTCCGRQGVGVGGAAVAGTPALH